MKLNWGQVGKKCFTSRFSPTFHNISSVHKVISESIGYQQKEEEEERQEEEEEEEGKEEEKHIENLDVLH